MMYENKYIKINNDLKNEKLLLKKETLQNINKDKNYEFSYNNMTNNNVNKNMKINNENINKENNIICVNIINNIIKVINDEEEKRKLI